MTKRTSFSCLITLFISFTGCNVQSSFSEQNYDDKIEKVSSFWFAKHNNFADTSDAWGNYTINLSFESLLMYDLYTGNNRFSEKILDVMEMRNFSPNDTLSYRSQPFCSIEFPLFLITEDSSYLWSFIEESYKMRDELDRSPEGAVCFYANATNPQTLLIDFIQSYCLRMARSFEITGDISLARECVDQFKIHQEILQNPETGLWSQGRGWLDDPAALSPGAWSRGHGWLLRGMVLSLNSLDKKSSEFLDLKKMLNELLLSLKKVQDKNGMWHIILDRDFEDSYPETSGTGMIAGYSAIALKEGYIESKNREAIKNMLRIAIDEMNNYLLASGEIMNTCEGPGPLYSEAEYINSRPFAGNEHGYQAFIHAFTGGLRLAEVD